MMRRFLLLPLLLGGCSVMGPDFKAPDWSGPGTYGTSAQAKAPVSRTVEAPVDPNWWTLFNDRELTSLEARVAKGNLDLAIAAPRIEESRARYDSAVALGMPGVNGNASFNRQKASDYGVFGIAPTALGANGTNGATPGGLGSRHLSHFDVFQFGFDASWEIDLWGKIKRGVESATASSTAAEEARRGVLLSSLAEVARQYVALRGVQTELRIARDNVRIAQDSLKLTQQREAGGVTTNLDVANASAQVNATQADIPALEQQESQLINALSLLLGLPPNGLRAELAAPHAVPPVPPTVPVGLPSELARRRPDVREAEANLHAATADIGVAEAAFYPSFKLTGSVGMQSVQFGHLFDINARQYGTGPGLSVPIFEAGQLKAGLRLTKARQQEAALTYQKTVLTALHEVDNALVAYRTEQERRQQLTDAVTQNRRALDLARDRYAHGVADFLTVLDAQRTLLRNEQLLAVSTTTVSANLVVLYKALGGGWQTDLPEMAAAKDKKQG